MIVHWSSLRRLAHILRVALVHGVEHGLCLLLARRRPGLLTLLRVRRLDGPDRLRVMIEDIGGTFIKFGQMLALQPDILSIRYCNALFDLLDRVEPFDYAQVERTFLEELGRRPTEIFDSFERAPLATASIGQVHVASIGGRKVAVKVQRPKVEVEFNGDVRLMTAAILVIKRLRLKFFYWLVEPMREFIEWTREELDYRFEGRYMEQLRRNARNNPCERIPEILWDYTTRRTLVLEFLEGVTVLEFLRAKERGDELLPRRLRALGFEPDLFAGNIIGNFVSDAFTHGMFHADLHPANLMILPNNVVGYIDFGITAILSGYSRRNLIALTHALSRADLKGMCAPFFNVSVMDEDSDPEAFRAGLERLGGGWYEMRGRKRELRVNVTMVMLDMIRLSRQTGIWPERDVVKYIRSAVAADGLITRLSPGFDLGRRLEVVCREQLTRQARSSLFTYNSFLNWATSNAHLMEDGVFRFSGLLNRMAAGELNSEASDERRVPDDGALRKRAVQLAGAMFVASLLVAGANEPQHAGFNLFTAASLFVLSAGVMLWGTLRKLTH